MTGVGVELVAVTKRFGSAVAVDAIDLSVAAGEFVSLLGPSGCGKSTTLRILAGFEHPDEGDIRFAGRSVVSVPAHRREAAMVFQDYALFPHRTVAQNLAFGLRMRKTPKDVIARRVDAMLELLNLTGMRDRKPDQLSGGQRQRVALGRALVAEPGVVLLDEPLAALDLQLRKRMQIELKQLHREVGGTFIYVTHDQEEAITMSDRIAVMHEGRIVQFDPVAEVYRRPANRFVAEFIGEANVLEGVVEAGGVRCGPLLVRACVDGRRDGDPVLVVVRPERVRVGVDAQGADTAFDLNVTDVVFTGPTMRVLGRIGESRLQVVTSQEIPPLSGGAEDVRVGWDAADTLIMSRT